MALTGVYEKIRMRRDALPSRRPHDVEDHGARLPVFKEGNVSRRLIASAELDENRKIT